MKIVFYHELEGAENISIESVLQGSAASSGGMGRIWIAVELAKLGHSVTVYHHLKSGGADITVQGVRAKRVPTSAALAGQLVEQGYIDVLVLNFYDQLVELLRLLKNLNVVKVLWAGCNPPFEWCDYLDQKHLHRMVCVSNICREPYRFHPNFKWVDWIHSSMNGSVALPKAGEIEPDTVAFLGALREEKGFHHVLRSWPLIRKVRPRARLLVCGSIRLHYPNAPTGRTGVMTPAFEKAHLGPLLGKDGRWDQQGIEFLYPMNKQALLQRLAQTAVGIVNPNLIGSTETYCLSAVEMQACGCPCIGGGADGLLETISDGVSGFHLRTQLPEELADKVTRILSDSSLRKQLSEGALGHSLPLASSVREAHDWERLFADARQRREAKYDRRFWMDLARKVGIGRLKVKMKLLLSKEKNEG